MIRNNDASICLIALVLAAPLCAAAAEKQVASEEKPYRVVDGKVDESTFLG